VDICFSRGCGQLSEPPPILSAPSQKIPTTTLAGSTASLGQLFLFRYRAQRQSTHDLRSSRLVFYRVPRPTLWTRTLLDDLTRREHHGRAGDLVLVPLRTSRMPNRVRRSDQGVGLVGSGKVVVSAPQSSGQGRALCRGVRR
jgi:hypothetical protein